MDFSGTSYGNVTTVENAIKYLGVKSLRDSPNSTADLGGNGLWQQVANATGAKFDAYLGEGSVATMQSGLANAVTLAKQGILNFIEGGNEEDQSYATSQGNSLSQTAAYQQTVNNTAHSLGLKTINMSFGTGWSKATGDYGTVGNLASVTDYANDHVYFGSGNAPLSTLQALNSDANLAANGKSVINSEMGWYTTGSTTDSSAVSPTVQAKYMLDGLMDAYQAGNAKTYLYELLDQHANSSNTEYNFGLFNADGTAKPAATALHNLTSLLADNGANATGFTPGSLSYSLSGTISTDHSMLMEKSDGTYWLTIWNEARLSGPNSPTDISVGNHSVTLNLASSAGAVTVYDPMSGTSAVQSAANAQTVSISVPDHPILVEISGASGTAAAAPTVPAVPTAAQENQISLLYEGALGRTASSAELNYWSGILANDVSASDQAQGAIHSLAMVSGGYNGSLTVADGFLMSAEFQSKYAGLDNTGFVTQVYENALHRAPEAGATQYWDHLIDTGTSRAVVLVAIAESPEALKVNAGHLMS
ncbi:MAG TPA: DUF4214 domain-containing protein [Magnetospirillaceae bacterium]|nr:DUF4214 domain-containing protein [Magnetospirillaceae bacterium]